MEITHRATEPAEQSTSTGGMDNMPQRTILIDSISVDFPFEPYPTQVNYMRAVIQALNAGSNALLESPTGTGKTLCILCATLSWVRSQGPFLAPRLARPSSVMNLADPKKAKPYRVVYVSRTHAQLAQVVREYKRTVFATSLRSSILGSREHMCVNRQVSQLPTPQAQSSACNHLRNEKECRYFKGIHEFSNKEAQQQALGYVKEVRDIEDLCKAGRTSYFCPYFHQRMTAEDADIVFLPYSYVTDSSLRRQLPFLLDDCILVMDEGHNIPSLLTSAGSFKLAAADIATAVNDCSRAIAVLREEVKSDAALNPQRQEELYEKEENFSVLKLLLCRLESAIAEEDLGPLQADRYELVKPGSYMHTFLSRLNVTKDEVVDREGTKSGLTDIIGQATIVLAGTDNGSRGLAAFQSFLSSVFSLDIPQNLLDVACRFVLIGEEPQRGGRHAPHQASGLLPPPPAEVRRTLGFWCLDTSSVLQAAVAGARSVLVTSGTLSPMDHFAAELGIPFDVVHQGQHVIDPHQLFSAVLCRGPGGQRLNGSYTFRNNRDYRFGLGMSLVNLARNVPGGMLVFFPSYVAMSGAMDMWKTDVSSGSSCTIWGMLCEEKAVFVEPTEGKELQMVVQGFQKAADESRGAVLFAVCRGKVSEGVDFADRHGRCVLVTGIPFANHSDLFVRLKREYITSVATRRPKVRGRLFTGDDWYRTEAMRAVNQCIGRVIRHRHDFGSIVLADERFAQHLESISPWVASSMLVHEEFRQTYSGIAQFFASHRSTAVTTRRPTDAVGYDRPAEIQLSSVTPPCSLLVAKAAQFVMERETDARKQRSDEEEHEQSVEARVSAAPQGFMLPALVGFTKQVVPVLAVAVAAAQGSAASLSRSSETAAQGSSMSSKELCAVLKAELPAAGYDAFRAIIGEIAKLHTMGLTPDGLKARFVELCDAARALFAQLGPEREQQVAQDFGTHIPEAYRRYYAQLLRKRPRVL